MDDVNRSISEYVKSGKYYEDAHSWYANQFIFVVSQRAYIILLLGFFSFSLAILSFFYLITNPAPPKISYVTYSQDIAKSYSVIFPAGGNSLEDPQTKVAKYMLATYVSRREKYTFGHLEEQLAFVRSNTVGTEYLKYEKMMSINNPSSPLMLYQDTNVRNISVKNVNILKTTDSHMEAAVYFDSTIRNIASNHTETKSMIAIIAFKIDDIEKLLEDNAKKLNFLVLSYSLYEDKKG
jgi:type IV secretion system protein VirB8